MKFKRGGRWVTAVELKKIRAKEAEEKKEVEKNQEKGNKNAKKEQKKLAKDK